MKLDTPALNPALANPVTKPAAIAKNANMDRIDETAREFEAMFLSEMLRPMFESVKVDENFGGGRGEEMFRGFMRDEYAKNMSLTGGVGIAELVREQLIAMQSAPGATPGAAPVPAAATEPPLARNMQGLPGHNKE